VVRFATGCCDFSREATESVLINAKQRAILIMYLISSYSTLEVVSVSIWLDNGESSLDSSSLVYDFCPVLC